MAGELSGGATAAGALQIIFFDLILSGDNAVVIGVVASRLHGRQRRLAIMFGAAGAVVLRIALATVAILLLKVPALAAVGGFALFFIGARLLKPEAEAGQHRKQAFTLREAMVLIILADVVMSLDNVLTVAAAARGNVWLLIFGLALSIPLLFIGAGLIAFVSTRMPFIIYLGSALIFHVAVVLILEDSAIRPLWGENVFLQHAVPWLVAVAGPALYVLQARWRGRPVIPIRPQRSDPVAANPEGTGN